MFNPGPPLTSPTGTERFSINNVGPNWTDMLTGATQGLGGVLLETNATTVSATASVANLIGAATATPDQIFLSLTGATAGNTTLSLPTVAALEAQLVGAVVGQSFKLRVRNVGSGNQWTIGNAADNSWTLTGTMTIANNTWRDFVITMVSATAFTITNVGGGNVI